MKFFRHPYLLAFFSSILLILSHPLVINGFHFPNLGWLGWFALIPLLYSIKEVNEAGGQFKIAFFCGIFYHLGTLYWLYTAMTKFGGLSPLLSSIGLAGVVLIISVYFGIIFLFSKKVEQVSNCSRFWTLPLIWVLLEYVRNYWPFNGFPWGQLGYTQASILPIIQIADKIGVYGVTAWVIWVNLGLYELFFEKEKKGKAIRIAFFSLIVLLNLSYGFTSLKKYEEKANQSPKFKIALLQGNIPQDENWIPATKKKILEIYQELTNEAFSQGAKLAIWPEAAYPYEIPIDKFNSSEKVGNFKEEVLVGAITYESKGLFSDEAIETLEDVPASYPIRNSVLLIPPGLQGKENSNQIQTYHKHRLVPFGEYIPFDDILPIKKLTPEIGSMAPGTFYNLLDSKIGKIGMLICYEAIFPEIARTHVKNGAELLITVSNDAWYEDSSALPQHLNFSIFRAIENRRFLARATNTGISAFISPTGKIYQTAPTWKKTLLVGEVGILTETTLYAEWGAIFVGFVYAMLFVLMIRGIYVQGTIRNTKKT